MLKEADDHISGQQLCEQFQVSRTAVWKVINQLKEEGYQVEAVRNKGYRIIESPDVLTREELSVQIGDATRWAGQEIVCFTETDSTNVRARKLGENGAAHGTLVVAEQQTAGRGRRGRGWESPAGSSIYMSLLLRPEFLPNKAPMLTIVMAYSVATALREQTGLDFRIKWPNDIVLNGKKVVGILTEMSTEIEYINHVVIGVGINVNTEAFPEEICATATSIRLESGKTWRRAELIAAILRQFEVQYERFVKEEDLAYLREAYDAVLVNCNREVRILGEKDGYRAVALGIDRSGRASGPKRRRDCDVCVCGRSICPRYLWICIRKGKRCSMEETVLCVANSYERKFYLNPEFASLPESIRQELQIMCVLYTEDVGGIFMVVYNEDGELELKVEHASDDFAFDEIGSVLKIKELQRTKEELFESLELYYKVFFLGEELKKDAVDD